MIKTDAIGRFTRDPETKKDGMVVGSVACDTGYGEKKRTVFFDCLFFGKAGETVLKFCKKGDQIWVSGEPDAKVWTPKDGEPKVQHSLMVRDFTLLGSGKGKTEDGGEPAPRTEAPKRETPAAATKAEAGTDDDLPF